MSPKRKILQLVTLSEIGGAQQVVYSLAQRLQEEYDITVACAPSGYLVQKLNNKGIRVHEIPELHRNLRPWYDLQAFWKIYKWIVKEKFDLVHTHSTKAGILGRFAAKLADIPAILFTAHGWAFTEGRTYWKRWLLAQLERMPAPLTKKIICVSQHDRELALQFGIAKPKQLTVIHNGIDPNPFLELNDVENDERINSNHSPVLLFVGRLVPQKDPLTLLRAIKKLSQGKLLIYGDGRLHNQVKRFISKNNLEERVILGGVRYDLPHIYAKSDVFVLASRWEGLPLTIIEAMLSKLPVIASKVGGVPELVNDSETGFLIPPQDPTTLARTIERLLEDDELRDSMGQAGRRRALEKFTLDRMIDETRKVYQDTLAESS